MAIFDQITIVLDRKDIEKMKFKVIKDYMSKFDFDETLIYEYRNRLDISIYGYNKDKRELFEIIEVVNWFRQSVFEEHIPWFLLLSTSTDSQSLKLLTYCFLSEPVKGDDELWHFVLNNANMKDFFIANFGTMNNFFNEKKLTANANSEVSDEINNYFNNWLGEK
jgi:hypothetical protein